MSGLLINQEQELEPMKNRKKVMGRPRLPEHLKAKPKSKTLRAPLEIVGSLKTLVTLYREGLISADDIKKLANRHINRDNA